MKMKLALTLADFNGKKKLTKLEYEAMLAIYSVKMHKKKQKTLN